MRAKWVVIVLTICWGLLALSAAPAGAAQRIDLRVLLLGATGSEPSYLAWQAQLKREGVPFDELVATPGHTPITDATLSRTLEDGTEEARYQAVVVATGGLPRCDEEGVCASALAPEEWTALQTFEQHFSVRQLTAYTFPNAEVGLNAPTFGGPLDGVTATLTADGQPAFPYLKGDVAIGAGTWGYEATPVDPATFSTFVTDPNGASLVGVFTHPEGRQELVQTFDSNQFQIHSQLLRHGELAWATRGTYLGDERNYLELQVDDIFLPDDVWDTANNVTDFDPAHAIRMTDADVAKAVEWSQSTGLRIDNVFNGGGSVAFAGENGGSDPVLSAFQANKAQFGWINHTYDHPNLDCSTRLFIVEEIKRNHDWAVANGFSVNRGELVTGEHSGLANLIPGNPGMIDPPEISEVHEANRAGTLPAGLYDYALTATTPHGETLAARDTADVPAGARGAATGSVRLTWEAVCHGTGYHIYRRTSPAGGWLLVGTVAQPRGAFRDTGALTLTFRDTGFAGSPGEPPAAGGATLDPYAQNPNFANAIRATNSRYVAGDASKPYPQDPLNIAGPVWPAGTSFLDGIARVLPRYPTNVYYNVATQEQQLDEYNYLYLPPWLGGGCVNSAITTCRESPATWEEYVAAESQRIFGHMMGNDPRPHYFHQSNLAETDQPDGAIFYPVLDAARADYARYFNSTVPIVQLSHTQIGVLLGRQDTWASLSRGTVGGYVEGDRVVVTNGGEATVTLPLTGTEIGTLYGGSRSGWANAAVGTSTHRAAAAWPAPPPPPPPPAPITTAMAPGHADEAATAGSLEEALTPPTLLAELVS